MKQMLMVASALVLALLTSTVMLAQGDRQAGTWALNVAKSKYVNMPQLKSNTPVIEAADRGQKDTVRGVTIDGKPIACSYTTKLGSPSPISGTGVNDADTVVGKRVDANTVSVTETKAGKVVRQPPLRSQKMAKCLRSHQKE